MTRCGTCGEWLPAGASCRTFTSYAACAGCPGGVATVASFRYWQDERCAACGQPVTWRPEGCSRG